MKKVQTTFPVIFVPTLNEIFNIKIVDIVFVDESSIRTLSSLFAYSMRRGFGISSSIIFMRVFLSSSDIFC